jgi:DnaJ-class molecular chaperone
MGEDNTMLVNDKCNECGGTGISFIESSSFLGLIKKQVPINCPSCGGKGFTLKMPACKYCHGRGLLGNEREICRVCNGTGSGDDFAWVPRSRLKAGNTFQRVCQVCRKKTVHEIMTDIVHQAQVVSWEEEEGLRKTQTTERVQVRCSQCSDMYWVTVNPDMHPDETTPEMEEFLAMQARVSDSGPELRV